MAQHTIIQWNCRGFRANYEEIATLRQHYNPKIICMQETKISIDQQCKIRNYKAYNNIGPVNNDIPSGGSSILVHNGIPHHCVTLNTIFQAVAIKASLHKLITICSIYIPPSMRFVEADLLALIAQLEPPFLLLGDVNSHNTTWGCGNTDAKGRLIENILSTNNICLFNDKTPTYQHPATGTLSGLDLSLCHPSLLLDYEWRVLEDGHGSDHFPIILSHLAPHAQERVANYRINKANWPLFGKLCKEKIKIQIALDTEPINKFTDILHEISDASIPKSSTKPRKYHCPWFDKDCHNAIASRKHALRVFKNHPSSQNHQLYNIQRAKTRQIIKLKKKESWHNYVNKLNYRTPTKKIWDMIKKITGKWVQPPVDFLKYNNTLCCTQSKIANALAECFSKCSSSENLTATFLRYKNYIEDIPLDFSSNNQEPYNLLFSIDELEGALSKSRDTAVGHDLVHYQMIKHMPACALRVLLRLYNCIWVAGQLPEAWKKAIVIPIPKPGKDTSNPVNYRPIALTSCLCKILERMVNSRLIWYLENHNYITPYQSGFRKYRTTLDNLIRIETHIREAFIKKQHTVAIFFDIEKAYDTTWKHGIMKDLHACDLRGRLPIFVADFLRDRTFQVRVGSALSCPQPQELGVPQGSVLSVTLFAMKINSIPSCLVRDVQCSLFVDDFAIYYSSSNMNIIERKLQLCLKNISNWTTENGFKISKQKSVSVHFCNLRHLHPDPELTYENEIIPVVPETKFLGLLLDKKLNFRSHIRQLKDKCNQSMNIIKVVSNRNWGADSVVLLKLYRSLIRSKLDYGCFIYGSARRSYIRSLDTIHHQGLRISLGAFRTSPVHSLYVVAQEPPLELRREKLGVQFALKLKSNPGNPAYDATFHPDNRVAFLNRPRTIAPFGIRLEAIIQQSTIDLSLIAAFKYPPVPLNILKTAIINLDLAKFKKSKIDTSTFKSLTLELLDKHVNFIKIYTDGSKGVAGVGCAVVGEGLQVAERLPTEASVFTAELRAIQLALHHMRRGPPARYLILSDSLSSLQAIKNIQWENPSIAAIITLINTLMINQYEIVLAWIPSHVGIPGNEQADHLAKGATNYTNTADIKIPHTDYKYTVNRYLLTKWQERWNEETENKFHRTQPEIKYVKPTYLTRRDDVAFNRCLIGHSYLTHGYLLRGEAAPQCQHCGCLLTIKHILVDCPSHAAARQSHFNTQSIDTILSRPSDLISFLKNILVFNEI